MSLGSRPRPRAMAATTSAKLFEKPRLLPPPAHGDADEPTACDTPLPATRAQASAARCCPRGIRHLGGAKSDQALVWNVRTCRPDAKGDVQAAKSARARVPMRGTGTEQSAVGVKVL